MLTDALEDFGKAQFLKDFSRLTDMKQTIFIFSTGNIFRDDQGASYITTFKMRLERYANFRKYKYGISSLTRLHFSAKIKSSRRSRFIFYRNKRDEIHNYELSQTS